MRDGYTDFIHKKRIPVKKAGDILMIGDAPKLVVDLKSQNNYIETRGRKIPYHREVLLSKDLLEGKRKQVFDTAVTHYYNQACSVVEGMQVAEEYRAKANKIVREIE